MSAGGGHRISWRSSCSTRAHLVYPLLQPRGLLLQVGHKLLVPQPRLPRGLGLAREPAPATREAATHNRLSVFNVPSKRSAINVLFPGGRDGLQTHLELRETPSEPGADDDSMPRPSSSPGSSANAPGRSAPSRGTSAGLPLEMSSSIMPLRPLTIGDDDVEAMRSDGRCSRRANLKAVRVAGSQSMSCS